MKITKTRLREIIKEELTEVREYTALDDALGQLGNLIQDLNHEKKQGRDVVLSSPAWSEDINLLDALLKIQNLLKQVSRE